MDNNDALITSIKELQHQMEERRERLWKMVGERKIDEFSRDELFRLVDNLFSLMILHIKFDEDIITFLEGMMSKK